MIHDKMISELNKIIKEIDKEIYYQDHKKKQKNLSNGNFDFNHDRGFVYKFECEETHRIPEDVKATITIDQNVFDTEILIVNKNCIHVLITDSNFPFVPIIKKATLEYNLTYLLEILKEKFNEMKDNDYVPSLCYDLIFKKFIKLVDLPVPTINTKLNKAQNIALKKALNFNIHYVWGPPGTGKTKTISEIIAENLNNKQSVLLLSHANKAVDEALYKYLNNHSKDIHYLQGKVVRLGIAHNENMIKQFPLVNIENILEKQENDLALEMKSLQNKKQTILTMISEIKNKNDKTNLYKHLKVVSDQIRKISNELDLQRTKIINSSIFLATTLTKTFSSKLFPDKQYSTVIIDESSMVAFPYLFWSASLASRSVVVVGDFMQLIPIATEDSKIDGTIFSKNIYDINETDIESVFGHDEITLLDTQYRMNPMISKISNEHIYKGKIKDALDTFKNVVEDRLFFNNPLILLDTSTLKSSYINKRRLNIAQAIISLSFAKYYFDYHKDLSIGIVCPYAYQANIMRLLAKDMQIYDRIDISTIHSFQGNEKDIIIFDLVDTGYRNWSMLNEKNNKDAFNLINVAITRAKSKMIFVGDSDYIEKMLFGTKIFNIFSSLKNEIRYILSEFMKSEYIDSSFFNYYSISKCVNYLIDDIKNSINGIHSISSKKKPEYFDKYYETAQKINKKKFQLDKISYNINLGIDNENFDEILLIDDKILWITNFADEKKVELHGFLRFESNEPLFGFLKNIANK